MEEVFFEGNKDIAGLRIKDEEVDTLTKAIDVKLWLTTLYPEKMGATEAPNANAGKEALEAAHKSLEDGQRVLSTEADIYLAHISLTTLVKIFNRAVIGGTLNNVADELNMTSAQLTSHAITAYNMSSELKDSGLLEEVDQYYASNLAGESEATSLSEQDQTAQPLLRIM